jgi:hypothetical protein
VRLSSLRLDDIENVLLPELWAKFHELERLLNLLSEAIVIVSEQTIVRQSELESIKYQVASLAEGMGELEGRVATLEKHSSMTRWVLRQVGTVLLVAAVSYAVYSLL